MQNFNKKNDFSAKTPTIKGKILTFSVETGVKISTVSDAMEVAKSNFRGKNVESSINAEAVARFLVAFPNVSADWLMRDEGPMLRTEAPVVQLSENAGKDAMVIGVNNGTASKDFQNTPKCDSCDLLVAKDQIIAAQQGTIDAQRMTIEALRR